MKLFIIQNYDYNDNWSYITVTDTKEKAIKIANGYIDKRLEDEANFPEDKLTAEEDSEGNFLNREEGRLNLEDICGVDIIETELNKPLEYLLGGYVLN